MKINFNHENIKNLKLQDMKDLNHKVGQAKEIKQLLGSKSCNDIFVKPVKEQDIFDYLEIKRLDGGK